MSCFERIGGLVFGLLLAAAVEARAHPEEGTPLIRSFASADGTDIGQVWRMRSMDNGMLVFSTAPGLSFYDGTRFQLLAVPGTHVFDIAVDGRRLAVGTSVAVGHVELDQRSVYEFRALPPPDGVPSGAMIGRVAMHAGRSFFLSRSHILIWNGRWSLRPAAQTYSDMRLRDDGLWAFENGVGLLRFDESIGEFIAVPSEGLPKNGVGLDPGSIEPWLATDRQRLYVRNGVRWQVLPVDERLYARLASERIESFTRLPSGDIAVGTRFGGYYQLSADGKLQRQISSELLPGQRITDIQADRENGLWLTLDGGIARIELNNAITQWDRRQGAMQVERIARVRGTLYLATRVGLKRLVASNDGSPARLESERIDRASAWDVMDTRHGMLVGTGDGLVLLPFDPTAPADVLIDGPRVSALARMGAHIYAALGNRIARLTETDGGLIVDAGEVSVPPGFDLHAEPDALWLSSDGATGVARISALAQWPQASVQHFDDEPLSSRVTFARGDNGGTWILADGVLEFDGQRLVSSPSIDAPLRVLTDAFDGQRWAAVRTEVKRLVRDGDGYRIAERPLRYLWHPWRHMFRDADGTLWLGEDRGLLRVAGAKDPGDFAAHVSLAEVADVLSGAVLIGPGLSAAAVELPATARDVRIRAALAAYAEGEAARFEWRYRINGGAWSKIAAPEFQPPSLGAGQHTIDIEATSVREARTIIPLSLRLTVAPFWYESTAARVAGLLALALLAALLAWAYAKWRTQKLEAERLRLESVIAERTLDIRAKAEEIAQLSEARTRFFAHVSHEFRTPLTLILGPLGDALGERFGALSAPLASAISGARENAKRLLHMVGELLDLSRLSAGRFDLHVAEHDLAEQLRREVGLFQPRAEAKQIELLSEGLSDPLLLWYDRDQLERMISNLLGNALKFTPSGGRVVLRLVPARDEVGIEVEDNGPGVALADQSRVFERFYQGSHAPADAPGTGIGLALVRELIGLHQGRVELISDLGQGACFVLWLKRGVAHFPPEALGPAEVAAAETMADPRAPLAFGVRPTVLVVDDHSELRRYLADRLGDNYSVISASDGDEALERIGEALPDVVISDVMMPGVDGLQLAHALRRNPETAGIPLLLLSAKSHKRDIVAGLDAGADDYLTKPFDTSELIARIEALLDARRRLRRTLIAQPSEPERPTAATANEVAGCESDAAEERFRARFDAAIAQQLADPAFGVAELAKGLFMDRATLFRRCKQSYRTSPSEVLRERRLAHAQALLRLRRGNVSEVAYASGFDNLSYFAQAFKKRYGCAPSAMLNDET